MARLTPQTKPISQPKTQRHKRHPGGSRVRYGPRACARKRGARLGRRHRRARRITREHRRRSQAKQQQQQQHHHHHQHSPRSQLSNPKKRFSLQPCAPGIHDLLSRLQRPFLHRHRHRSGRLSVQRPRRFRFQCPDAGMLQLCACLPSVSESCQCHCWRDGGL